MKSIPHVTYNVEIMMCLLDTCLPGHVSKVNRYVCNIEYRWDYINTCMLIICQLELHYALLSMCGRITARGRPGDEIVRKLKM